MGRRGEGKPYTMVAGAAFRLREYTEPGMPEMATVKAEVARRCEYVREQWLSGDDHVEFFCAVFKDPKTGKWYAQRVFDETKISDEPEEVGDGEEVGG